MAINTKEQADQIINLVNESLAEKRFQLDQEQEEEIRRTIEKAFREGYKDCLKDVREGLIK